MAGKRNLFECVCPDCGAKLIEPGKAMLVRKAKEKGWLVLSVRGHSAIIDCPQRCRDKKKAAKGEKP